MRRLLLARHAKSSWDHPELSDHDRPLNDRGRRAAPRVAEEIQRLGYTPDLTYSSTSVRTRETWAGMEEHLGPRPRVEFLDDLYLSSPGTMLGVIQATQRSVGTLMILAHNPGTHSLAVGLARSGDQGPLSEMRMKFPTGAVAVIDFDVDDWSGVDQGGQLIHFIRPRALTD